MRARFENRTHRAATGRQKRSTDLVAQEGKQARVHGTNAEVHVARFKAQIEEHSVAIPRSNSGAVGAELSYLGAAM